MSERQAGAKFQIVKMGFFGSENYKITRFHKELQRKQSSFHRSYLSEYWSDENRFNYIDLELIIHNTINHIDGTNNDGDVLLRVGGNTARAEAAFRHSLSTTNYKQLQTHPPSTVLSSS